MINLEQVNWRKDAVTQRFIGDTNPYAEELARRAGMLEKYRHTSGEKRYEVVCRAAKGFNILLI